MTDIKLIKEYIKLISEFIDDIETIFSTFSVVEEDIISRIRILELVTEHNRIILMKKKDEQSRINEIDRSIATKVSCVGQRISDCKANPIHIEKTKPILSENDHVQIYMDLINEGLDIEEIMEDIFKKKERDQIISQILLRCYGELKIYNDFRKEGYSIEVQNEIDNIKKLIELINLIRDIKIYEDEDKDDDKNDEKQPISMASYKVIFYKTALGHADFVSDIKSIAPEYYENFDGLLNSIMNGQPIYWRKLTNHGTLRGINEVKLAQCRIAYIFYDNHCIILQAFVKKMDIDMSIYRTLAMRLARFNRIKDDLINDNATIDCETEISKTFAFLRENNSGR